MKNYNRITNLILLFIVILSTVLQNQIYGQTQNNLEKIDQFLQTKLKTSNIQGFSVAIVDKNKVIFSKGYGKTGDKKEVSSDTPFAIASLSKAFTAMAIMQLVEKGKINLDSNVNRYLPSFPLNSSKITVRQLLNQTSGLSDKVFPEMRFSQQPSSLDNSIIRLKNVKLVNKPGEKFQYHNPNYQILAKLIEITSGEDFSEYLKRNIFIPLRMKQTFNFTNTKDFYSKNNISEGYTFLFGYPVKMKEIDWFVEGSAGMVSTSNDMAKWLMLNLNNGSLYGNSFLSKDNLKIMQTPPKGIKSNYGMGWFLYQNETLNHNGILWTFQSEQLIMINKHLGIVILFNSGLNSFQDYSSFIQGITDILNGKNQDLFILPTILYEIFVVFFIIIALYFGIRRLKRTISWYEKFMKRPKFISFFKLFVRLMPLLILIAIPQIFILISGRDLSWKRIFWTMPSIIIWVGIVSFLNLVIIFSRLKILSNK